MGASDPIDDLAEATLGFQLRDAQRRAVEAVLSGRDTLAVLPTGSGKSAIYQVAGLLLGGLTLVVSPLIALQRDQLRSLASHRDHPIRAAVLNSSQHVADRRAALESLRTGTLDFLLLSPEQLGNAETRAALLANGKTRLVAVDEAHLVSDWGHDFRPDYLLLAAMITALGRPTVLALTATAAPPVQADITRQLAMNDPEVIVSDFDRPNISLAVRRTRSNLPEARAVDDRVVEVVVDAEVPALVYAQTRARCEELAQRLHRDALRAASYHAGLSAAERATVQDEFFSGALDVVVATSAFGMGIDKSDVRTVVHAGVPGSVDEYYQEIGRAGRDGQPAAAVMVYDDRTIRIPRLLAARSHIPEESVHAVAEAIEASTGATSVAELAHTTGVSAHRVERLVNELLEMGALTADGKALTPQRRAPHDLIARLDAVGARHQAVLASRIESARTYAESTRCRRAELLAYFGEQYPPPCGNCDNDQDPTPPRPTVAPQLGGTPVHHRLWGVGTMLSRDEHELIVVFDSVGYRHLTPRSLRDGVLTIDPSP